MTDLTKQESHFAFGENWSAYSRIIDGARIARSDADLAKLLPPSELRGKTVIDIGCGSGLPALSMLRSGAVHVTCVDIDPHSVRTTQQTLSTHAPRPDWTARVDSVFDLTGSYDVVYSWGVLHHTGDMWRAINRAAALVKPGGTIVLAVYFKTPLCGVWRIEKRFYSRSPKFLQLPIAAAYSWTRMLGRALKGRGKELDRGMDIWRDAHDWLGGYPYESTTPQKMRDHLSALGFTIERENLSGASRSGVFGSACDEYVFRRAN